MKEIYFRVMSKLGREIRVTKSYWSLIISMKHPSVKGKEKLVKTALQDPSEIRQSKRDPAVFLYYRPINRNFIAIVCKHLNGDGYIITVYLTDKIKEGVRVWKRQ